MAVLVGKQAPDFNATAVFGNNEIKPLKLSDYKGKYVVMFFYPLDFTFVCPSELIAFDHRLAEFKQRGVEVIGVSIDSQVHPPRLEEHPIEKGGIGQVGYPLVADVKHEICRAYDVEFEAAGVAFAAPSDRQRPASSATRSNDRRSAATSTKCCAWSTRCKFTEEHGEVCPAGWQKSRRA